MHPKDIAEKWQAVSGVIRPVNPHPYKAHRNFGETISEREIFEQSVVDKHTYPAPDLADGEYDADGLEFVWQYKHDAIGWTDEPSDTDRELSLMFGFDTRQIIRLKTPAIAKTEEKGESVPNAGILGINGKMYPISPIKKENGLKKEIIELVLNLAAPDDDCMLSDFLHALQYVLNKHQRTQPDTELIKFVLEWVDENWRNVEDHGAKCLLPAITEAWGKEKGNAPR